jgi:hypothetical protein
MRKRILHSEERERRPEDQGWLDLERLAEVEITSEDTAHPIEAALIPTGNSGWRAGEPGEQTVRLLFDQPLSLKRIRLVFKEEEFSRHQEFVLRWSMDGHSYREIVRQQYHFSPPGTPKEEEEYHVELTKVRAIELVIIPETGGGEAIATLQRFRLA